MITTETVKEIASQKCAVHPMQTNSVTTESKSSVEVALINLNSNISFIEKHLNTLEERISMVCFSFCKQEETEKDPLEEVPLVEMLKQFNKRLVNIDTQLMHYNDNIQL